MTSRWLSWVGAACALLAVPGLVSCRKDAPAVPPTPPPVAVPAPETPPPQPAPQETPPPAPTPPPEAPATTADALPCAGLHWVERYGERVFVKLAVSEDVAASAVAEAGVGTNRPVTAEWTVWDAPLTVPEVAAYRPGLRLTVLAVDRPQPLGVCTLRSFHLLTRGTPHFGWVQEAKEAGTAPTAPGCGSPEIFAALDCPALAATPAFAFVGDTPAIQVLAPAPPASDATKGAVLAALRDADGYRKARLQAAVEARERGAEIVEEAELTVFQGSDRALAVVAVLLKTGDGSVACGADDVRHDLLALVRLDVDTGALREVLRPLAPTEAATVRGLVSARDASTVYVVEDVFPNTRRLVPLVGPGAPCAVAFDYCDCPC